VSSPLEFIASRVRNAKTIGKLNQRGQQHGGIGVRGGERVVSQQIDGTALLIEIAEAVEIAGERTLMAAVGDATADDLERSVKKNDGGLVEGKQFAIGGLEKSSTAEG
jgi:hypothetical protein